MSTKLEELTKIIYKEGVEKGRNEANSILENAEKDAKRIIDNAKKEADAIIKGAIKENEQLAVKTTSELKLASNQAITLLKQNVTELLSKNALKDKIEKATSDESFIKEIIKELIAKWDTGKKLDIDIILPEKSKAKLGDAVKKELKDILDRGVEIKFDDRMKNGFKITPKDSSYIMSFTESDFLEFFQSFLKTKTKSILFS